MPHKGARRISTWAYSPECVEGRFRELRLVHVLGSPLRPDPIARAGREGKAGVGAALVALSIFVVGNLQARRSGHARRGDPHTQGRRRRRIGEHADDQPVAVAASLPQQRHVAGVEQIAHYVRALSRYREAMLIYSMSVSVDGFIADREGAFGRGAPSEELFRFHLARVRGLGGYLLGRRLYETMLVWETDPSPRDDEAGAAFADVWRALPKVVFSS